MAADQAAALFDLLTLPEDGLTLVGLTRGTARLPWAAGSLLPTVGRSTWAMRVESYSGIEAPGFGVQGGA